VMTPKIDQEKTVRTVQLQKKLPVSDPDRIDFALLDPGPRIFFENVDQDLDPGSKETD
jgi:hypothetical protein